MDGFYERVSNIECKVEKRYHITNPSKTTGYVQIKHQAIYIIWCHYKNYKGNICYMGEEWITYIFSGGHNMVPLQRKPCQHPSKKCLWPPADFSVAA